MGKNQFVAFDNVDALQRLVSKYQKSVLKEIPEPNIWVDKNTYHTLDQYILIEARKYYGNFNDTHLKSLLKRKLLDYIHLHLNLFGFYNYEIFNEPSWDVS